MRGLFVATASLSQGLFAPTRVNLGLYRILRIETISTTRNRPQDREAFETRKAALTEKQAELKQLKKSIRTKSLKLSNRYGRAVNAGIAANPSLMLFNWYKRDSWDADGLKNFTIPKIETDPNLSPSEQLRAYYTGVRSIHTIPPVKTRTENVVCAGEVWDVGGYVNSPWMTTNKYHARHHPRIHIRVKPGQIAMCKYCCREYVLVDEDGAPAKLCEDRPPHYPRTHLFEQSDEPGRMPAHLQEQYLSRKGEFSALHASNVGQSAAFQLGEMRLRREESPYGWGPEHGPVNHTQRVAHAVDNMISWPRVPRPSDAPRTTFFD